MKFAIQVMNDDPNSNNSITTGKAIASLPAPDKSVYIIIKRIIKAIEQIV
jgi:hypothetical protein